MISLSHCSCHKLLRYVNEYVMHLPPHCRYAAVRFDVRLLIDHMAEQHPSIVYGYIVGLVISRNGKIRSYISPTLTSKSTKYGLVFRPESRAL